MTGSDGPFVETEVRETHRQVRLRGDLTLPHVTELTAALNAVPLDRRVIVDLSGASQFDTAAAWSLAGFQARLGQAGHSVDMEGASQSAASLLSSVSAAMPVPDGGQEPPPTLADRIAALGETIAGGGKTFLSLIGYLGLFLARLGKGLRRPGSFPMTALVHHCEDVGVKAVPIVGLMAFLIGIVLAFQGATQLRQFGAEVFVVDLIAISILRELGILLTAIIVAGRTASSFTAAIGSMKMREEIDAMQSLGIDPALALFVPRILALLIMLPILGLVANVLGLFGGLLMAWIELGVSPGLFMTRLLEGTDISHVIVGMVKAPVFALIIGIVGCHAGMQVKSNAESLGRMTSSAVVAAIFAVIVADAIFSIFFAQIGM